MTLAVACVTPVAKADTIAQSQTGAPCCSAGPYGQSVTTTIGGPWNNITFNFYGTTFGVSFSYATGNLYLLTQAYAGSPAGLSASSYIAVAPASAGTSWIFDPSVTLQANTQYFFYMDSQPGGVTLAGADGYSGGDQYVSSGGGNFFVVNSDMDFALSGALQSSPGPVAGAGLLSYLIVACGGAAAYRKRLRAWAQAITMLKRRTALATAEAEG